MSRQDQINLLKRLLHYVETRTTAMADSPWRNEVSAYTDAERLAEEQRVLFRRHPLVMGFASDWPAPGSFSTDDPCRFARSDRAGTRQQIARIPERVSPSRRQGSAGLRQGAAVLMPLHAWTYDLAGQVMGIPDERCFPDVRSERASLVELPLCEKYGLVWVIPTADGSTNFDIDPWLGGLAEELASFGFASWSFYDRRLIPETMNWKIVVDTFNEGYHVGFLHRDSLRDILHGNVTDFEAFGLNHRLTFPRRKLARLKAEPEDKWDLMWNTTLVYSLFPNTVLLVQGDHVELARVFPREGRTDRSVMDLGLYVPKAPSTEEERIHWDKNMQLVLDVVTGEDFPTGRSIQIGLTSGAQTHTVYGRNEPAMIHYYQSMRTALGLRV
jgi:phenylpropionate dioxygenase-like ring-hydroxylating dioxygenase large terminal subunit